MYLQVLNMAKSSPGPGTLLLQAPDEHKTVSAALYEMHQEGVLCDTVIQCYDRQTDSVCSLSVHACVLAAASPVFKEILCGNVQNATEKIISDQELSSTSWHFLIEFIYLAEVLIPSEDEKVIEQLNQAAKKMSIQSLVEATEPFVVMIKTRESQLQLDSLIEVTEAYITKIKPEESEEQSEDIEQDHDYTAEEDPVLQFLNLPPPPLNQVKEGESVKAHTKRKRTSYLQFKNKYEKINNKYHSN